MTAIAGRSGRRTGASIVNGLFFATFTVWLIRGGFPWARHITQRAQAQPTVTGDHGALVAAPASLGQPAPEPVTARPETRAVRA